VNPKWGDTYLGGLAGGQALQQQYASQLEDPYALSQLQQNDPAIAQALGVGYLTQTQANAATGGPELSMIAALNPALYSQIGGGFNWQPIRDQYNWDAQERARLAAYTASPDWTGGGG
jgi:hypothetical protein